jgi:hypothetical protein
MARTFILVAVILSAGAALVAQPKTELRPEAVAAYEKYAARAEQNLDQRLKGDAARFLSVSGEAGAKERLRTGAIEPKFTERSLEAPGGLIQDWTATMYVKGTSGEDVVALLTDYARHQDLYAEVIAGKVLRRDGTKIRSSLRLLKEKVFTVVLDTEHDVEILKGHDRRWQLRSRSARIQEIRDAGKPTQMMLPEGQDSGFLWRLNAYWSIQEDDGGVYVECRSVTLTRGVPLGLGWIVKPFTLSLPRDSLVSTLEATKRALQQRAD